MRSFFKRRRQAAIRIALFYVLSVAFVAVFGALAIAQFDQISLAVYELTNPLAVERTLSQDIRHQILRTRFFAHQYVRTQAQVDLDQFNIEFAILETLLTEANQKIGHPERVSILTNINAAVLLYEQTFARVTALVQQRQKIYAEILDIESITIENTLTALRVHVLYFDNDAVFLAFGNVQNAFRLISLNTAKFLDAGEARFVVEVDLNYQQARVSLESLATNLKDPAQLRNLAQARAALERYYQGFGALQANDDALKDNLSYMLDVLEPEISDAAQNITQHIEDEYQSENELAQTRIQQTRVAFLGTLFIAGITGLLLGIVFYRYFVQREQAERELRESETRYRTLFEGTPIGLYRTTPAGKVLDANPICVEMLKYPSREALLAENAVNFYADPSERTHWKQLIETEGGVQDYVFLLQCYDGTVIVVRNKARTVRDAVSGEILHYEGSIEDITEQVCNEQELENYRAHLEQLVEERTVELQATNTQLREEISERLLTEAALEKAIEAAEAANRAKSIFLANMSHELRTPLNAILGFSELMTYDSNLTSTQQENLETIGRSGEHLLALINDVLELSKIEAGKLELQLETFDLHQMLLGLGEMFSLRAEKKKLTVVFDFAPDVPQYVYVDLGKLRQVLINLLGNAVKFTEKGGVTLRVSRKSHEVGNPEETLNRDLFLYFEIVDTGPGIATSEMDVLFDAFSQTESGRQLGEGTGLGLPISQQYVRLMGGELGVDSAVGHGSTFSFTLPVIVPDEVQVANLQSRIAPRRVVALEPGQRAPDGGAFRILIADDIASTRDLLAQWLTSIHASDDSTLGFDVRTVSDGQQAVTVWEQWRPHLIFMDMRMPVMDGRVATQRIKSAHQQISQSASQQIFETIIIAITASAFEEDRATVLDIGCDDFIRKPFREVSIFAALETHLGVHFIYESSLSKRATRLQEKEARVDTGALRTTAHHLEPTWIAQMQQATMEGDAQWMEQLTEQIRESHPELAQKLAEKIYDFDHDTILTLLKNR